MLASFVALQRMRTASDENLEGEAFSTAVCGVGE